MVMELIKKNLGEKSKTPLDEIFNMQDFLIFNTKYFFLTKII
jgi:hypothetical protein